MCSRIQMICKSQNKFWKSHIKFSRSLKPSKATIYKTVAKSWAIGSVLDNKKPPERCAVAKYKLHIGAHWDVSQLSSMWDAKMSMLQAYFSHYDPIMHSPLPAEWTKCSILKGFLNLMCFLTQKLCNFFQRKRLALNQHINSQNNRWFIDPYKILTLFRNDLDVSEKLQSGAQ